MRPSPRNHQNSFLRTPHLWQLYQLHPIRDRSQVRWRPVKRSVSLLGPTGIPWRVTRGAARIADRKPSDSVGNEDEAVRWFE